MKFYVGNDMLGNKVVCEESQVKELVANSTDAANEKHVPVVTVKIGRAHV